MEPRTDSPRVVNCVLTAIKLNFEGPQSDCGFFMFDGFWVTVLFLFGVPIALATLWRKTPHAKTVAPPHGYLLTCRCILI